MTGYLLDTNCISEIVRPKPEPRVTTWMETTDENLLYLSVLTLGEIRRGIANLTPGKRRTQLERWLDVDLESRFAGRIVSVDRAIADRWGSLTAALKHRNKVLPVIDGLLAATALHHRFTIVSRNITDFSSTQVKILNPWEVS